MAPFRQRFLPLNRFFYRLHVRTWDVYIEFFRFTLMVVELTRLLLGVVIAIFHRPIATGMMRQERALDVYFRQRGIRLPNPPSDSTAQNLYFFLGIFICLIEAGRIWIQL